MALKHGDALVVVNWWCCENCLCARTTGKADAAPFLLGLGALSDHKDGVAHAALWRPPFFWVTLDDLVQQRTRGVSCAVVDEAEALITRQDSTIAGKLLGSTREMPARRAAPFESEGESDPWWQSARGVTLRPLSPIRENLDEEWTAAAARAFVPRLVPASVSAAAHVTAEAAPDARERVTRALRKERYGPLFGSSVHRGLELLLSKQVSGAQPAAERAAKEYGYEEVELVRCDVTCAELALRQAGLLSHELWQEYPIAGSLEGETLLAGYIDLVAASDQVISIIDYKTDQPPRGPVEHAYPAYVAQVRSYLKLLERSGVAGSRSLRAGLLFTADGSLHWV